MAHQPFLSRQAMAASSSLLQSCSTPNTTTFASSVTASSQLRLLHSLRPSYIIRLNGSFSTTPRTVAQLVRVSSHHRSLQQEQGYSATSLSTKGACKILVPLLAAVLLGNAQPVAPAIAYDEGTVVSVTEDAEKQPGEDAYQRLLQKIKERREKRQSSSAPGNTGNGESVESSPVTRMQQLREASEKAQKEREAAAQRLINSKQEPEATEPAKKTQTEQPRIQEKAVPAKVDQKVEVNEEVKKGKQRTHGFMPLFLAQFLLLVAAIGGGVALVVVEESEWKKIEKAVEEYIEKISPIAEDAYGKVKPIAEQALQRTQELGEQAKPYVQKAWETSKPLAAKVYESSKPLLKEAQGKVSELLLQAQQKVKN